MFFFKFSVGEDTLKIAHHIFKARQDNAKTPEERVMWESASTIFECTIDDDFDSLKEFDYLQTTEEKNKVVE